MKYKIVALFGEAGTGKDAVLEKIPSFDPTINTIVSLTTRPPREGEKDGVNYHFVTESIFHQADLIEQQCFRNWWYGTPITELKEDVLNVGAFNIAGIKQMLNNSELQVYPVRICASEKERILRQIKREREPNYKEICRRFLTDESDFEYIPFSYLSVDNGDIHSPKETAAHILWQLGKKV